MKLLLSPAKKIDFEQKVSSDVELKLPVFNADANELVRHLQELSSEELQSLMSISSDLANLNYNRYANWDFTDNKKSHFPALWAFRGEVYTNLDVETLSSEALKRANNSLRILSGLYGVLGPSDLIQAYRLEMGTKFSFESYKNLYAYWKSRTTDLLNKEIDRDNDQIVVNLASTEYSKSIDMKKLNAEVVTPIFKDLKGDNYKVVSFWAKRARGLMTRYILENGICDAEGLLGFDVSGYYYHTDMSKPNMPVFVRDH
ncbi:peroxide stress protein YaaA [Halosquirtibacter laminarini]|uniref:Peroxide stress protein YaaA n=1 Tax=Halosquirtibacter laminarini TaxID=3374600 RepID=A0AC61NIG1_9BACT|nr:peroxide stress protein YaaA [Prolixibacteraceae bacterium]